MMNIKNFILKYPRFSLFGLNLLFFILVVWKLPIHFEENDDIMMCVISSGAYSGIPDMHLVFINSIYGLVLNFLYSFTNSVEWYTLFFLIFHYISINIISGYFLFSKLNKYQSLFFLFFLYLFEIRFLLNFQFTTTASLLSIAGVVYLFYSNNKKKLIGVILFVVGSLIRFDAAMLMLLILMPFLLVFKLTKLSKSHIQKTFLFIGFALCLSFALKCVDFLIYKSDKEWSFYYDYNKVRGVTNDDNPNFRRGLLNIKPVNRLTSKEFNYEYLKQLKQKNDTISLTYKTLNIYTFISTFRFYLIFLTGIFIALLFLIKRKDIVYIIVPFVIFMGLYIFISMNMTVKPRVFFPGTLALLFCVFNLELYSTKFKYYFTLLFVGFILIFVNSLFNDWKRKIIFNEINFKEQQTMINAYFESNSMPICVYGCDYNIEYIDPLRINKLWPKAKIMYLGWLTYMPSNKIDSFNDLKDNYSLFISKQNFNEINSISKQIEIKYGFKVKEKIIMEDTNYRIVSFQKYNLELNNK